MKILLGTHHYFGFTGTETFACTLAFGLKEAGHAVDLYSPYAGGTIAQRTRERGVRVLSDLARSGPYEVIHVSHNIVAYEARQAFPGAPMVYQAHGVLPFLEQPPRDDLGIARYLAVSEEVRDSLRRLGVPGERITIFRNCVDTRRFRSYADIRPEPKNLLVISGRMGEESQAIAAQAAEALHLEMTAIGEPGRVREDPEHLINQADIVISLGRGAVEAMACGRAALVYDYLGGDGMVTPENIDEIQTCNFSGRRFARQYGVQDLVREIGTYSPAMGRINRRLAEERFSVERNLAALLAVYRQAVQDQPASAESGAAVRFFVNGIRETREYERRLEEAEYQARRQALAREQTLAERTLARERREQSKALNAIRSSRAWRWAEAYYRLRDRLLPPGSRRRRALERLWPALRGPA